MFELLKYSEYPILSVKMAEAPARIAEDTKLIPCEFTPGNAANKKPSHTFLLSLVMPVIAGFAPL